MPYDRQPPSPSRIPRFSPSIQVLDAEAQATSLQVPQRTPSASSDIIGQLLDDLLVSVELHVSHLDDKTAMVVDTATVFTASATTATAAAAAAAGSKAAAREADVGPKPCACELTSKASAARRSAITALREGIDARCDEPSSIEAMEALAGTAAADDDLLLLPASSLPCTQQDATLQVRP